jgi:hypothetical protein
VLCLRLRGRPWAVGARCALSMDVVCVCACVCLSGGEGGDPWAGLGGLQRQAREVLEAVELPFRSAHMFAE